MLIPTYFNPQLHFSMLKKVNNLTLTIFLEDLYTLFDYI